VARDDVGRSRVAPPGRDPQPVITDRQAPGAVHVATVPAPRSADGPARASTPRRYARSAVAVLFLTHERFLDHDAGHGHPERPARLTAVLEGIGAADVGDALVPLAPRAATAEELARVHRPELLARLEQVDRVGGGPLDADTAMGNGSLEAAVLAAGAGPTAIEALDAGLGSSAFCAVRPPGHHATPSTAMGFCLLNNVAVAAGALADRGERVLIVDYDAHHGNGTQDVFWSDGRVAYVSMHQHPLYPGTGGRHDVGAGAGLGLTLNVPLPRGATGDTYRAAIDLLVVPLAESFAPTWVLLSAGFDAHRADPLTDLGLSAGDFGDLTEQLLALAPAGHRIAFLEGGYDLAALSASAGACISAMAGAPKATEARTAGGPGRDAVDAAVLVREALFTGD
jgi:acetoin utilization deacetylase AcuC-like enzyme